MTATLQATVVGIGFWSPSLPGWPIARDVLLGLGAPPAGPPARVSPRLLPPNERRRAPDTVAIALEVAGSACEMAGIDPRSLPSIFASTHGDLPINDYMCSTLASTPTLCSPTKFHNSVHNAAAGYWTIGTGCVKPSTALTAWHDTFANGLLEALVQATAEAEPVLYVCYDVEARGPLAAVTPSRGLLAASLVLDPRMESSGARRPRLECSIEGEPSSQDARKGVPSPWADLVPENAMRPCLSLLGALAADFDSTIQFGLGPGCRLVVTVKADNARGL